MNGFPEKETLDIEFKSDLKSLPDVDLVDAVVGMANTTAGELYLGVEDDGTATGLCPAHQDAIGVVALIANKTQPSLSVKAEILERDGKRIMRIAIPNSRVIVATADGKVLKRRLKVDGSPENVPMYPYELTSRLSELGSFDYSNTVLWNACMDDLDANERNRLRTIIRVHGGERNLLDLDDDELDKALNLARVEQGALRPTVTGLLLLGKKESLRRFLPTATSVFQVLEGASVRMNEKMVAPLLETLAFFEQNFKAWNPSTEVEDGLLRIPVPEFSEDAFREGIVNAFCHRDYAMMQSVRLAIEDEGLTISSPGGFIEGVNLRNLLTVEPHGRNPALADALKRIGLAERTGRGIDRIYQGSIIYGRPMPDYSESTSTVVKLFIQRAAPDFPFAKMIANEENRLGRSLPINSLLILSVLKDQRRLDLRGLADITNIGETRLRANVEKLLERGLVESARDGKRRIYFLSAKVYRAQDDAMGYVRQTGIDQVKHEEMTLKLLDAQGYATRKNLCELLGVSEGQSYRILKKLSDQGVIVKTGKGRSARYILMK